MWVAVVLTCEPDDLSFDSVYTGESRLLLSEKLQKAGFSVSCDQIEEGKEIDVEKNTFKRFIRIMRDGIIIEREYSNFDHVFTPSVEREDGYWVQHE
jgi:hypothetical protein